MSARLVLRHDPDVGGDAGVVETVVRQLDNSVQPVILDNVLTDVLTLYIDDICVDENARGKHIGRALYEHVRHYAKSIGCNNITLNVWEGNAPAWHFYKNMGMQVRKITMETIL